MGVHQTSYCCHNNNSRFRGDPEGIQKKTKQIIQFSKFFLENKTNKLLKIKIMISWLTLVKCLGNIITLFIFIPCQLMYVWFNFFLYKLIYTGICIFCFLGGSLICFVSFVCIFLIFFLVISYSYDWLINYHLICFMNSLFVFIMFCRFFLRMFNEKI